MLRAVLASHEKKQSSLFFISLLFALLPRDATYSNSSVVSKVNQTMTDTPQDLYKMLQVHFCMLAYH